MRDLNNLNREHDDKLKAEKKRDSVKIIKDGLEHDIEKIYDMTKPFSFKIANKFKVEIKESDTPIYFARKRMKVSSKGKIKESYIHRYCVGKKNDSGKEIKHWLFADGQYDTCGDKPSS